jgi:dTMP kinase
MHPHGVPHLGFFLTLEGPEGSGKSTQAGRLAARLGAEGYRCVVTREPGGTALGEQIRQILLHSSDLAPAPSTDALLFCAARAQLVADVIGPALARGEVVVCDRFGDSTLAYQGYGAGLPLEALRSLIGFAAGDLRPDLTILMDLPAQDGLKRKQGGPEQTRFEAHADLAFHQRVRDGFLALAAAEPARFVVIDGRQPAEAIEAGILEALLPRLAARPALRPGTGRRDRAGPGTPSAGHPSEPRRDLLRMDK